MGRKTHFHTSQWFRKTLHQYDCKRERSSACLCKQHVCKPRASLRTRCNSLLSHSSSLAWQTLPHQASCDSLPVPALHLHSSGWCHGRFSSWSRTLPIWSNVRMYACVFMCVHPSACLAQTSVRGPVVNVALHSFRDDLLHEAKALERTALQTGRGGREQSEHGFSPKAGLLWDFFSPLLPSLLVVFFFYDTNMQFACLLVSVYSIQPSVNTYRARVVLFSSEEKQPLDVLNICRNNYSRLFYHRWPQWKW